MNSKEKLDFIIARLEDVKAIDIKVVDITEISILCDYFVIATGTSNRHIRSLVDEVDIEMKKAGEKCNRIEGYDTAEWILIDFGDVVVNVFKQEMREFYNLEKLWADGQLEEK